MDYGNIAQVYIDGKPYIACLPTGNAILPNLWKYTIDFLGKHPDSKIHWLDGGSWCCDFMEDYPDLRLFRGAGAADSWLVDDPGNRYSFVGYRPCLIPLDPISMKPSFFDDGCTPFGGLTIFGSIYVNGSPVTVPHNLMVSKNLPGVIPYNDIPDYIPGSRLHIGDSDPDYAKQIRWFNFRSYLIADRLLFKNISWNDLDEQGLVNEEVFSSKKESAAR